MRISPALRYARANFGIKFRPDPTTVLWLPGQDDAYSTTIRDKSGNGNDGTIYGATWVKTGPGLWCLSHDGTDDYVDLGTDASLLDIGNDTTYTIMVWAKSGTYAADRSAISLGSSTSTGPVVKIRSESGVDYRFRFYHTDDASNVAVMLFNSVSTISTWYHLAAVRTAANAFEFFVNGASVGTSSTAIGATTLNTAFLGKLATTTNKEFFNGRTALVRILNASLTVGRVLDSYNQERHLFGV